ncbi:MAG: HEPN domain-containing protein [Sedimentisphaerales bacterium]|nr:HEPN domain-containing protein [Sedimentisphaerales bacterium]
MNPEIEKELHKADAFLREIEHLIASGLFKASMERAYYAMFHAATAAIMAKEIDQGARQAIIPVLDKCLVKTGLLDKKFLGYLRQAFNASKADSERTAFGSSDHRQAQMILLRTREFVAACKKLCE